MAQNKINKTGENMNKNNIETFKVDYSGTCIVSGIRTNTKAKTKYGCYYVCLNARGVNDITIWNSILNQ